MEHSLYEIVKAAQNNDEKSKLFLITKFSNTIKYYSKKLCYDCAETDLIIFFLTLLTKLNLEKIKEFDEGSLINYFYISIKREYIRLSKKISYINSHEILLDNDIIDFVDNRGAKSK